MILFFATTVAWSGQIDDGDAPKGRVEIPAMRTMTAKHFKNPDGTQTGIFYASPIHYRDDNDLWQEIDLHPKLIHKLAPGRMKKFGLVDNPGQARHAVMDTAADRYGPLAQAEDFSHGVVDNNFGVFFPKKLKKPIYLGLTPECQIYFLPLDANTKTKLALNSDEFLYDGIWPEATLRYRVIPSGLKESIIMAAPGAPAVYRFFLALRNCTAQQLPDGGVDILAGDSRIASLARPWVRDAAYEEGQVYTDLAATDGGYILTYRIDEAWLRSQNRAYPVELDPTVTLSHLSPVKDTYLDRQSPTIPRGYDDDLRIGNWHNLFTGYFAHRIMIQFDLSSIPSFASVTMAKLSLYCFNGGLLGGTNEIAMYPAINDWAENVTWSQAVNNIDLGNRLCLTTVGDYNGWHDFIIDSAKLPIVAGWRDPSNNHGMVLKYTQEDCYTGPFRYHYSSEYRESDKHPYFQVNYTFPLFENINEIRGIESATINWTTQVATTNNKVSLYKYDDEEPLGDILATGENEQSHSAVITGLDSYTLYKYKISSVWEGFISPRTINVYAAPTSTRTFQIDFPQDIEWKCVLSGHPFSPGPPPNHPPGYGVFKIIDPSGAVVVERSTNSSSVVVYSGTILNADEGTWTVEASLSGFPPHSSSGSVTYSVLTPSTPTSSTTAMDSFRTLDSVPPTIPGMPVSTGGRYTNNTSITFNWTPSTDEGGSGVKGYEVYIVGDQGTVIAEWVFTPQPTYTFTAGNDGTYTCRVRALDNAAGTEPDSNRSVESEPGWVMVDTTAPLVELQAPDLVTNTLHVTAQAVDFAGSGVQKVIFQVDGDQTLTIEDTTAPYEADWDTTFWTEEIHTITAQAIDLVGNIGTDSFEVKVDRTPITCTNYYGDITMHGTKGQPLTFSVTATGSELSYRWSFGNGQYTTTTTNQTTYIYTELGTYDVSVMITYTDDSMSINSMNIVIENTKRGRLFADETWSGNHTVEGDVLVPAGITLNIEQNTIVTVNMNRGLQIEGILQIGDGVTFDCPTGATWNGIRFQAAGSGTLAGTTIRHALRGVACTGSGQIEMTGVHFVENTVGLHCYSGNITVTGCTFLRNTVYGIKEDNGCNPLVVNCIFSNNTINYYDSGLTILEADELNELGQNNGNQFN